MGRMMIGLVGAIFAAGSMTWSTPCMASDAALGHGAAAQLVSGWHLDGFSISLPKPSDRGGFARAVVAPRYEHRVSVGPFEARLNTIRARKPGLKGIDSAPGLTRATTKAANLTLAAQVCPDLTLIAGSGASLTKRRLDRVPFGSRPLTMTTYEFAIGATKDNLGTASLTYVDVATRGRRRGLDRMAELIGGAPLLGKGLRLALTSVDWDAPPSLPAWTLSFASLRRPISDVTLATGSLHRLDNRVELGFHVGF